MGEMLSEFYEFSIKSNLSQGAARPSGSYKILDLDSDPRYFQNLLISYEQTSEPRRHTLRRAILRYVNGRMVVIRCRKSAFGLATTLILTV